MRRLAVVLTLLAVGCASPEPDFRAIYDESARWHDARRNPIIVIPGILGSNLKAKGGQVVWGAFTSDSVSRVRTSALLSKQGLGMSAESAKIAEKTDAEKTDVVFLCDLSALCAYIDGLDAGF